MRNKKQPLSLSIIFLPKAILQVTATFRRDTFDAHESAYGYIDVIKDVRLDVKQYSQYFEKQIYAFEKRTKIWNVKVKWLV